MNKTRPSGGAICCILAALAVSACRERPAPAQVERDAKLIWAAIRMKTASDLTVTSIDLGDGWSDGLELRAAYSVDCAPPTRSCTPERGILHMSYAWDEQEKRWRVIPGSGSISPLEAQST